jgi:hypothetical protein
MLIMPQEPIEPELGLERRRLSRLAFWRRDQSPNSDEIEYYSGERSERKGLIARLREPSVTYPPVDSAPPVVDVERQPRRRLFSRVFRSQSTGNEPEEWRQDLSYVPDQFDGTARRSGRGDFERESRPGLLSRMFASRSIADDPDEQPDRWDNVSERADDMHTRASTGEAERESRPGLLARVFQFWSDAEETDEPNQDSREAPDDGRADTPERRDVPGSRPPSPWLISAFQARPATTVEPASLPEDVHIDPPTPSPWVINRPTRQVPIAPAQSELAIVRPVPALQQLCPPVYGNPCAETAPCPTEPLCPPIGPVRPTMAQLKSRRVEQTAATTRPTQPRRSVTATRTAANSPGTRPNRPGPIWDPHITTTNLYDPARNLCDPEPLCNPLPVFCDPLPCCCLVPCDAPLY